MTRDWNPTISDNASLISEFSNKKLKRINSTTNNSTAYIKKKKAVTKKKIKSIRTNSSKQNKKVAKNVKYRSPQKIDYNKYTFKIKSKLESFRKICFSKQSAWRNPNTKGSH